MHNRDTIPHYDILENKPSLITSPSYKSKSDEHIRETSLSPIDTKGTIKRTKSYSPASPTSPVFSFSDFEVSLKENQGLTTKEYFLVAF